MARRETKTSPADFLFATSTGSDESMEEDEAELRRQAQLDEEARKKEAAAVAAAAAMAEEELASGTVAKTPEPVVVKTERKYKRKASEEVDDMPVTPQQQQRAKNPPVPAAPARKKKAATAAVAMETGETKDDAPAAAQEAEEEEETLAQEFVNTGKNFRAFTGGVFDKVTQKALQKKTKPKSGDKHGFDRADLYARSYLDNLSEVKVYSQVKPHMRRCYEAYLKDIISNKNLLDEVCDICAEASVNQMTMFFAMFTPEGSENMYSLLTHLASVPEAAEDTTPTSSQQQTPARKKLKMEAVSAPAPAAARATPLKPAAVAAAAVAKRPPANIADALSF